MRHLATIQKVVDVEAIDGADNIEKITVLGWELVAKKGEFKPGDFCVYFEIDSVLPKHEMFSFMLKRKYRVKTAKFMKRISQGMAMPTSILPKFGYFGKISEGIDLTEKIGVKKYDPQAEAEQKQSGNTKARNWFVDYMFRYESFRKVYFFLFPVKKGNFPSFIPKTDEERVQNIPWIAKKNHDTSWYATEKMDGQSLTVFVNSKMNNPLKPWIDFSFGVCSRNLWLKKQNDSTWWTIAKQHDLEKKMKSLGRNIAIQGEIIGEGIQKNKYKITGIEFYAFSAFDIDKKRYLNREEKKDLFSKECLDLKTVPEIFTFEMDETTHGVKWFVEASKMKSKRNCKTVAEGLVFRCIDDDSKSFKAINPEFLLKHDE